MVQKTLCIMRKISLFLSVVLLALAMPFQMVADDDFVRGDVDLDGNVSIKDVTTLIDYLLSETWPEDTIPSELPETIDFNVNGVTFKMVLVEGGNFYMGATNEQGTDAQSDEKPAHRVTLSSYYICTTETTQALWLEVMGVNPSNFIGDNLPVEHVSWEDVQGFLSELNAITGKTFRLPTEAEWEYAARGGNKSMGYKYAGSDNAAEVAWYGTTSGNSGSKTHPVASKKANELGLYDMSGNVWEWCQDWYGSYNGVVETNPTGPETGSSRVLRSGSWLKGLVSSGANNCRVSTRYYNSPSNSASVIGFRLAMSVE